MPAFAQDSMATPLDSGRAVARLPPTEPNLVHKELPERRYYTSDYTGTRDPSYDIDHFLAQEPALENSTTAVQLRKMNEVAWLLGWVPAQNFCHGYYDEPASILAFPTPAPIDTTETTITSSQPSLFSQTGTSVLQGNVTVTQPGREANADRAFIYRDPTTNKVSRIELIGNVRYREFGKLLVGRRAEYNFNDKTASVEEGAYRISRPGKTETLNAWGVVDKATREQSGILNLFRATYTTCAPVDPAWKVKANHISLNRDTGRGEATNASLYALGLPVFYVPYFNFPIDNRRYSGFLYPTFSYSNNNGADLTIPYYLNLAPNYDDTVSLREMTKRNLQFNNFFRYLTPKSEGDFYFSILPNDHEFSSFKQTTPQQYPPSPVNTPFLTELEGDSDTRYFISSTDKKTQFNPNWSASYDINYVSDAYYFQDLGSTPNMVNADQLLNQGSINYNDEHWSILGRVQAYQTLHLINQDFVMDQYARLPQIDTSGHFYNEDHNLDLNLNNEFVDFEHASDFFSDQPFPTGIRANFNPSLSMPHLSVNGYFTPQLQMEATYYSLANNTGSNTPNVFDPEAPTTIAPGPPKSNDLGRVLPMFNIDSGLYFDRDIRFLGHGYRQTLEPRFFYLYVPVSNQNSIPIFDTTLPPFDYSQLFRTNRFVGYDRIGDANQVSLGVTSRFLDDYTGYDKMDLSLGEIFYFHKHEVCLYADCSDDPTIGDSVSPIAGELTYHLNPKWSALGSLAWDPNQGETDNGALHVQYIPAPKYVFNIGYDFVRDGDVVNNLNPVGGQNNLSRFDVSTAWPIKSRWSAVGDWNYNISHNHSQAFLYGLEYDSCCWAIRMITSRTLLSEDINGNTSYSTNYYVQFQLKGLANIGNNDPSSLLMSTIPGYIDNFRG